MVLILFAAREEVSVDSLADLVQLLWAALMDSGHEKQADKLKKVPADDLPNLIATLSQLEREVLNAQVHRAIALLKAVIGGKRARREFEEQCLKIQGLL